MRCMNIHPDERQILDAGGTIIGIDEVGRGPLAGPICAAACMISQKNLPHLLERNESAYPIRDSKKLTRIQREKTSSWITEYLWVGFYQVDADEIDSKGIQPANRKVLQSSMEQAVPFLTTKNNVVFVDHFALTLPKEISQAISIPRADATYLSVACASIYAKTMRDSIMRGLAQKHPEYGWDTNAGYGTKSHQEAIKAHGITSHHRKSFLTKMQFFYSKGA